jgi:hypothetical protein
MQTHPVPYQQPGLMHAQNPGEGWAAFGAVAGVVIGGITGTVISMTMKPASVVEAVADSPDEAQAAADVQARALLEAWAKWRRTSHIISGALATAGSGLGAYLGAAPHQKRNAAIGAAVGTGIMRTLNIVINPVFGAPGLVAGGVGAWIGASRAGR